MVTLEQLKTWLNVTGTTQDVELAQLLARTIDFVQRELDWYFGAPRLTTEILNGTGVSNIYLRQFPVITSEMPLVVSGRHGLDPWEIVEAENYEVSANGRFIIAPGLWPYGSRNVRVSYYEGFVETPGEIDQLILDLVSIKWRGRGLNPEMQSETIGDYSYTRADTDKLGGGYWTAIKNRWKRGRI